MNTVQKTDSATMETTVISQHESMNDAIDAAEIVAAETEDGSLVSVTDADGNEVWTNEGDWRGAVR